MKKKYKFKILAISIAVMALGSYFTVYFLINKDDIRKNGLQEKTDISDTVPFEYKVYEDKEGNKGIIISRYTGKEQDLIVPETIEGILVKAIIGEKNLEEGGFARFVKSVALPDTLQEIGDYAFAGSSVETVYMGGTPSIGDYAFANCRMLEVIDGRGANFYNKGLPKGISNIGEGAFLNCVSLSSLELSWMSYLPDRLFEGCTSLDNIVLWESYQKIGKKAFSSCSNLKSIEFSPNITEIKEYAFEKCTGLISIDLPIDLESLEAGAFRDCTGLKRVILPPDIVLESVDAFAGCEVLEEKIYE